MDLAEEFELELLAPRLVRSLGKRGQARLAGVVDEDVAASAPLLDRRRKALHRSLVEDVALQRKQPLVRFIAQQCGSGRR